MGLSDRKILLVNSLDARYGSTYRARRLWQALSSLGFECRYVESNYRGTDAGLISIRQEETVIGYLRASLERALVVLKESYNVVIIQKITPLTLFAIIAALLKGRPLVIDWDDLDAQFQSTRFRRVLSEILEWIIGPFCNCVSTHSKIIAGYAKKRGARHIFYLPQVVDSGLFDPRGINAAEEKRRLGLEGKIILGYIGTFTEGGMRDFDIILRFFKGHFSSEKFLLLIIGGGPLQASVEESIKNKYNLTNYLITGLIPAEHIPRYIAALDACLIYMRNNAGNRARVSLKLLEYLAMQKIVFGQVVGETEGMLGKYVLGFEELRPEDFSSLVRKKQSYLEEARRVIEEKYSLKAMSRMLAEETVFKKCL